jgi:hypothetical protein
VTKAVSRGSRVCLKAAVLIDAGAGPACAKGHRAVLYAAAGRQVQVFPELDGTERGCGS